MLPCVNGLMNFLFNSSAESHTLTELELRMELVWLIYIILILKVAVTQSSPKVPQLVFFSLSTFISLIQVKKLTFER